MTAGSYCVFCDRRCFVYRSFPGTVVTHWATCKEGAAYDLRHTGRNHETPEPPPDDPGKTAQGWPGSVTQMALRMEAAASKLRDRVPPQPGVADLMDACAAHVKSRECQAGCEPPSCLVTRSALEVADLILDPGGARDG